MSPEQVRAKEVDARSDLFSFGAVLYEMATGTAFRRCEFGRDLRRDPAQKLAAGVAAQSADSAASRSHHRQGAGKDRDLRYQRAADIRADLQRLKRDRSREAAWDGSVSETARGDGTSRPGRAKLGWVFAGIVLTAAHAAGLYYRSHRSKPLTDKDTIVLADFTNSTGDPIFDDTLKTALSVSLRQSPFLNVLSERRSREDPENDVPPAGDKTYARSPRELCQRAGSKAYLAGSIASLGSEYVLGLKAVNCQNGDPLAEQQVTAASKEKVLDSLGEAAAKLRS